MTTEEFLSNYEQLEEAGKRQIDEQVAKLIDKRRPKSSSLARVIEALNGIHLTEGELKEWGNILAPVSVLADRNA